MGLQQLNFAGLNKIEVAIRRLKEFEPPEGYYGAFGAGKDSITTKHLTRLAKVKVEWHYSRTGIDPPELVYYMRECHPDVIIDKPAMSMWEGIYSKGMPRRQGRWCCEVLKEYAGSGRRVITGIRWQESPRRQKRQMIEVCHTDKTKIFLHPIIDWTSRMTQGQNGKIIKSGDVWDFINLYQLPYCSLYDEGFKRLGCVLCPMQTPRQTRIELKRWPKLADAWRRACYRYWEKGSDGVKRWETPEAMWRWWLSRKGEPKVDEAQCIMFDN